MRKYLSVFISHCYRRSCELRKEDQLEVRQTFVNALSQVLEDRISVRNYEADELFYIMYRIIQMEP